MNSTTPVTAFSQKPNQSGRKRPRSRATGTSGPDAEQPEVDHALAPTTRPMPTVWNVRMLGYAQMVGAPATHWAKELSSNAHINFIIYLPSGSSPLPLQIFSVLPSGVMNDRMCPREDPLRASAMLAV